MDTEFHYYMTGMIAHAAGFSAAEAKPSLWHRNTPMKMMKYSQ